MNSLKLISPQYRWITSAEILERRGFNVVPPPSPKRKRLDEEEEEGKMETSMPFPGTTK